METICKENQCNLRKCLKQLEYYHIQNLPKSGSYFELSNNQVIPSENGNCWRRFQWYQHLEPNVEEIESIELISFYDAYIAEPEHSFCTSSFTISL